MSRHSWAAQGRLEHWWRGGASQEGFLEEGAVLCPLPPHPQHPAPAWHLVFPTLLHTDVKASLSLVCGRDWITYEPEHLSSLPQKDVEIPPARYTLKYPNQHYPNPTGGMEEGTGRKREKKADRVGVGEKLV